MRDTAHTLPPAVRDSAALERAEPYSLTLDAHLRDRWPVSIISVVAAAVASIEIPRRVAEYFEWDVADAPFWDYRWLLMLAAAIAYFAFYAVLYVRERKADRTPVRVELSDVGLVIARRNRTVDRVDWDRVAHARRGADDRPSAFVLTDDAGRTVDLWNGGFGVAEWRTLRTTLTDELTRRGIDVADARNAAPPFTPPAPAHP